MQIVKTTRQQYKGSLQQIPIRMISKNDAKYIQSLYHKKTRDSEKLFIAEGPKLVTELLSSGYAIKHIYALDAWLHANKTLNVAVTVIDQQDLQRISNMQTPNQVLAIAEQVTPVNEPVLAKTLTLVLDGIQDPGNLGTIIRISDWFGIKQIVAAEDTADIYNPKTIQASMGSIAHVNIWYKNLQQWLPTALVNVYGACLNGQNIYNTGNIDEGILVIGNEGNGIRNSILPYIQHPLTIPKIGAAESLNAAIATGIILSHIVAH